MEAERWIRSQARANWFIVGFTAILTVVAIGQWAVTYQILRLAMQQERAWVVLGGVKLTTPLSPTTPLSYSLEFQNVGGSPALDVLVKWVEVQCSESPFDDKLLETPDCPAVVAGQRSDWTGQSSEQRIVGPGKEHSVSHSFALSLQTQNDHFCFCGQLVYADSLCFTHRRDLCWYYTVKEKQLRLCDAGYTEYDEPGKCQQDQHLPPTPPPPEAGNRKALPRPAWE